MAHETSMPRRLGRSLVGCLLAAVMAGGSGVASALDSVYRPGGSYVAGGVFGASLGGEVAPGQEADEWVPGARIGWGYRSGERFASEFNAAYLHDIERHGDEHNLGALTFAGQFHHHLTPNLELLARLGAGYYAFGLVDSDDDDDDDEEDFDDSGPGAFIGIGAQVWLSPNWQVRILGERHHAWLKDDDDDRYELEATQVGGEVIYNF